MRFVVGAEKKMWKKRLLIFSVLCIFFAILAICFDFYYDLNDDMALKDILSGTYTGRPEGHNIQMLYPLAAGIAMGYRSIPGVPWFAVFLCVCQLGALYFAAEGIFFYEKENKKILLGVCCLVAGVAALFFYEWIFVQYTVTAGMLLIVAVVRIVTGPSYLESGFWKYHLWTILLAVLSFYLRTEMMLLLSPFLGLAILFRMFFHIRNEKLEKKLPVSYALLVGIIAAMMLLGFLADGIAYRSSEWKAFRQFFDDRTQVYDFYGVPDYDANQSLYDEIGLTKSEAQLLINYNFDLSDQIETQSMHKIAEYAAKHQEHRPLRQLYLSVYTYIYRFMHGQELVFDLLVLGGYLLLLKLAFQRKDKWLLLETILLGFVRTGLWLFLLYRGRVPERITHPLYLAELGMLLALLIRDAGLLEWKKYEKSAILIMCMLILGCALFDNTSHVRAEYTRREQVNERWKALREYCEEHSDAFYYLDVYSTVAYSEKLFVDAKTNFRNFDLAGGWCVKSPLATAKRIRANMTEQEAKDAGKALLLPDKYFVYDSLKDGCSSDFLDALYQDNGMSVHLEKVDRIADFVVIKVNAINE